LKIKNKMQTLKELLIKYTFNFRPAIDSVVRNELKNQLKKFDNPQNLEILDIGGRNSPYTCSLPGKYIISDLLRQTPVQMNLKLGIDEEILKNLKVNRSNVKEVVFDDMTETRFLPNSFDGIITVEVIEHVLEDEKFIKNACSLIKNNGFLILSTPNGDAVACGGNPDHVRHYKKVELEALLNRYFSRVEVTYSVPMTKAQARSQFSWCIKKPILTFLTMINGFISFRQSLIEKLNKSDNTWHLIAIAYK